MPRLPDIEKTARETMLNVHVPPQPLSGGKATMRPSGSRTQIGNTIYGERVHHGDTDRIERYIVDIDGEDVNEYSEDVGWFFYTKEQARGF